MAVRGFVAPVALAFSCGCAANNDAARAPPATPDVDASLPAVSFDASSSADAGPPEARDAAAAAMPWCDARYTSTPCAFRAYGICYVRYNDCSNKPCTESAPTPVRCPAGDAPAFMAAPRRCGRKPSEPVVPRKTGWSAAPRECDAILTTWSNVPHDDRACTHDSDCIDVEGTCFHAPLNVKASKNSSYAKTPCAAPGAGMCPNGAMPVRCESGCCVEQGAGLADETVPVMPP